MIALKCKRRSSLDIVSFIWRRIDDRSLADCIKELPTVDGTVAGEHDSGEFDEGGDEEDVKVGSALG